ncbi:MAG: sulfate ABC transporter substrate-binding protein [Thermoguttaceae bacterium]
MRRVFSFLGFGSLLLVGLLGCQPKERVMVNVSYDPTRELYRAYNKLFEAKWKSQTGESVTVKQSHGGSGAQARSVLGGQDADVVTLALAFDIDILASRAQLLPADWQKRLPHNSCPYNSTIVLMVRKGNPKEIKDWNDLLRDDIEIVTPNPKTSGGARWNYLAAWGYVLRRELGDLAKLNDPAAAEEVAAAQAKAREFVTKLFSKVKSMDTGARESTNRFVQQKQGDVFLAWENEALLSQQMRPGEGLEIIVPSCSIRCEPPVAVVDTVVERRDTKGLAEAYLQGLYEPDSQDVIARYYYRPIDEAVLAKYRERFPDLALFSIDEAFGGWTKAQREHFDADGVFDQIQLVNAGK